MDAKHNFDREHKLIDDLTSGVRNSIRGSVWEMLLKVVSRTTVRFMDGNGGAFDVDGKLSAMPVLDHRTSPEVPRGLWRPKQMPKTSKNFDPRSTIFVGKN